MAKARKPATTVDDYLAALPAPQQEIVAALRELIHKVAPRLHEAIKWRNLFFCDKGDVCAIVAYRKHVNLGFAHGADLSDQEGLLEGTGKGIRHVKIGTVKDIRKGPIAALIKEAVKLDK
jgi:hypothetical protein